MKTQITCKKHYITNGTIKARVHYSAHKMTSTGANVVTVYAKSFEDGDKLAEILSDTYENESDIYTDYSEKGRARIFETNPIYEQAYKIATN